MEILHHFIDVPLILAVAPTWETYLPFFADGDYHSDLYQASEQRRRTCSRVCKAWGALVRRWANRWVDGELIDLPQSLTAHTLRLSINYGEGPTLPEDWSFPLPTELGSRQTSWGVQAVSLTFAGSWLAIVVVGALITSSHLFPRLSLLELHMEYTPNDIFARISSSFPQLRSLVLTMNHLFRSEEPSGPLHLPLLECLCLGHSSLDGFMATLTSAWSLPSLLHLQYFTNVMPRPLDDMMGIIDARKSKLQSLDIDATDSLVAKYSNDWLSSFPCLRLLGVDIDQEQTPTLPSGHPLTILHHNVQLGGTLPTTTAGH